MNPFFYIDFECWWTFSGPGKCSGALAVEKKLQENEVLIYWVQVWCKGPEMRAVLENQKTKHIKENRKTHLPDP